MSDARRSSRRVRVWDAPTRLFHWLTAALVPALYLTWRCDWMSWHLRLGEALLALLLFRLLWGVAGSESARFARFLAPPRAALRHLRDFPRREPDAEPGHNPAGGWMVLALLALLLGETLTGVVDSNDVANEGPLSEIAPAWLLNLISDLHTLLWDALLAAILCHLLAISAYALVKRQNLLRAMITGWKRLPREVEAPRLVSPLRAALLMALAAGAAKLIAAFL